MKLIENNGQSIFKLWSVRFAAIAGVVAYYFTNNPDQLRQLIDMVPEQYRPLASIMVGLIVTGGATASRVIAQPKLAQEAKPEPPTE